MQSNALFLLLWAGLSLAPTALYAQSNRENWATESARHYMELAQSQRQKGQLATAVKSCMRAVQMDSTFGPAYLELGALREALGDDREALATYTLATRIKRARASAFFRRALLNRRLGRNAQAMQDLQAAVRHEPSALEWRTRLAEWYVQARAWPAALAVWRKLLASYESGAQRARAKVQVRALRLLCAEADPIAQQADRNHWVARSLARIEERLLSDESIDDSRSRHDTRGQKR